MSELITQNHMGLPVSDASSQYARMIPGVSATSFPRSARKARVASKDVGRIPIENAAESVHSRALRQLIFPHPMGNSFSLYRDVVADSISLIMVCGLQTLLFPSWSLQLCDLPLFAALVTLLAFSEGAYRKPHELLASEIIPRLVRAVLFSATLVYFAERDVMHMRSVPAVCAVSVGALLLVRWLSHFARERGNHDSGLRNILIVGGGPIARSIARSLCNDPLEHVIVQGFVDDDAPLSPKVLGRIADLDWLARAEFIDEIILAIPGDSEKTRAAAEIAFRNHLDIRAVPDLPPGPWPDAGVDCIGDVPVVTLHRESVPSTALFMKRLLDVVCSLGALVLAAPVMAVVGLLIRLDSPGPILYSAERTGAKGRRFHCYKFRSMVTDADYLKDDLRSQNQREGPIFKIAADPRITRIGRFIRRYSLDELPQLWNVLRGDMSMVGPRPHPVDEVNHYELNHYRRLDVKPGITGLWQITARHSSSFELNMHLDLTYIENWTLFLDMRILLSTIRVLFAPEGA
jgi:exopolysaccharide biosynthesis polyprenyl glycosylphosphotransferase